MAEITSPRIGFIGNMNERIDIQLLIKLAKQNPHWSIVIIDSLVKTRFEEVPAL